MRRISGIGAVAGGAWIALQGLWAFQRAGGGIPPSSLRAAAVVAATLAAAAAMQTASWAWRGPVIVSLPEDDVAVLGPVEAHAIRAAAQLRGSLGGAGYLHPARLSLPAAAWAAAAAGALSGPGLDDVAPWVAGVAALVAAAAVLPARPFFYREATGGRVVLHPTAARGDLLRGAPEPPGVPGAP